MINSCKRKKFKDGLIAAMPIVFGYFPIAMAFGLVSKNTSLSLIDTSLLSLIVYAGASQFMALDLISAGVNPPSIILAIFLLNIRHVMMSASLSVEFKKIPKKFLPILGGGITDETFSVVSFNKEKIDLIYVSTIFLLSYISWNIGTIVGYFVGEILPQSLQSSLSIGLYAMFAALLFPEIRKSKDILFLSLISAAVYGALYYSKLFITGWDIIIAMVIASTLGVIIFSNKNKGRDN